jgi:hypothetical protein
VNWLTLRRTYSSWAHEKGVPAKVIAQLRGHAKVDTTLKVYAQVVDGSLRKAADASDRNCSQLFTNRQRTMSGASMVTACLAVAYAASTFATSRLRWTSRRDSLRW